MDFSHTHLVQVFNFFEIHISWQYRYWGENMKTLPNGINMYKSLQFSHSGMNIMVLKCIILEGYTISI
jgi:hypothetical protein